MPSVLFVCTANQFRSPVAACLLERYLRAASLADDWAIGSAGIWAAPRQPVLPQVLDAARRLDIDLAGHRSIRVSRGLVSSYDLILAMQVSQKEALLTEYPELHGRVYLFSQVVERRTYDIPDIVDSAAETLDLISELDMLIQRGFESICLLATYLHNSRRSTHPLQN